MVDVRYIQSQHENSTYEFTKVTQNWTSSKMPLGSCIGEHSPMEYSKEYKFLVIGELLTRISDSFIHPWELQLLTPTHFISIPVPAIKELSLCSQGLGAIRCGGHGIVLDIFSSHHSYDTDVANSTSTNTGQVWASESANNYPPVIKRGWRIH